MGVANIRVEPMIATYGEDTAQVETITTVADVASSLQNKYFFLSTSAGVKHYFWFNVATLGTDPAPAGATGHAVALSANDTAAAVATALELIIDGTTGFDSTVSGNVITVTHTVTGYAMPGLNAQGASTPGFAFAVTTQGDLAQEVGCVQGDMEIAFEESYVDVTCHDTGATIGTQIKNGITNCEVTMSLQETTKANLKKMFVKSGNSFIPEGASATEVFGVGSSKDFQNIYVYAKKLVLHPKRLLASDKTEDITFFKAFPVLSSMVLSGENVRVLPVTFKVYPDTSIVDRVNLFAIGDSTQSLGV